MKLRYYLFLALIFCVACGGTQDIEPANQASSQDVVIEEAEPSNEDIAEEEHSDEDHNEDDHHDDEEHHDEEEVELDLEEENSVEDSTVALSDGLPSSDYLGSYEYMNEEFGTMVNVVVDEAAGTRTISSNALPNHETGEFPNPGNPNTISVQDGFWEYPLEPTFVGTASFARTPGVAISGVKFEPDTAERLICESGEVYNIEAIQDFTDLGLDFNNAHVQPTGEYHYHGVSELLVDSFDGDSDLVHVAFAADGHLIYYSKSGAYQPSYQLGTGERAGTNCTYTLPGPSGGETLSISSEIDGTVKSDWVFDANLGDLDECNGTMIDGQYVYLVTEGYPYVPRCLMGEVAGGQGGPGSGAGGEGGGRGQGGQGGGRGGGVDFAAAAETLGVTEQELRDALGGPPPDFAAAAEILGISEEALQEAIGDLPGGGGGRGNGGGGRGNGGEGGDG